MYSQLENYKDMTFVIKSSECGMDQKLLFNNLWADLQEAADYGENELGFSREVLSSLNSTWIVLKMKITINEIPSWKDSLTIRTWASHIDRLIFHREFHILDSNSSIIGFGTSEWILADKSTHRPLIPSKIDGLPSRGLVCNIPGVDIPCKKINFPESSFFSSPIISKYADYSEIDHNHHVNNTIYISWVIDALYKYGVNISKIKTIEINYLSEIKFGQKTDLYVEECEDGNIFHVFGLKDLNEKVFACEITLCD